MPDFFSTSGNQIVNSLGQPVKLTGVSWFGLETPNFAPDGLHVRNYKDMIDQMAGLGFNTLRIPYSSAALEPERTPPAETIDVYNANKELAGLTSLEILDKIIAYAGTKGLRVVLDHHRSTVGYSAQESGVWYTAEYPESRWISDWVMLAERYKDVDTVIGADLHNEPYGATWSQWASAAETAANTIHAVNPNWLMFVEGVAQHENTYYWWGGNLQGVRTRPIQLNTPNKVVYSPHDYPDSVFSQPWFQGENWETNLTNVFRQNWGFIYEEGMAPVFLGEWGSRLQETKDQIWFSKLLSYLGGDFNADGANDLAPEQLGISWSWWAWNPNSGDTGGLLTDGWMTIDRGKYIALQPIISGVLLPSNPDTGGTTGGGDTLPGTPEPDAPSAGSGNDSYVVNDPATLIVEHQGSGLDTVRTSINYALPQNVERLEALDPAGLAALLLIGNALSNEIIGNAGPNWIDGRGGVDTMIGLGGNDTYVVDHGADWVSEFAGGGTDTVLTSVSYALGGNSYVEILTAVRWDVIVLALTGNDFANKIRGNEGSNVLKGRGGNDVLSAYGGNDRLYGGLGADTLYGGAGKDAFFFDTSPARTGNVDRIADFNVRDDVIRVDNAVFRKSGPNGRLDGDAFTRGSAATDAEDRFIYNALTGSLFYDADGTGPANALKLAILKKGLLLTAADFAII